VSGVGFNVACQNDWMTLHRQEAAWVSTMCVADFTGINDACVAMIMLLQSNDF
jgi:hypothetical protein